MIELALLNKQFEDRNLAYSHLYTPQPKIKHRKRNRLQKIRMKVYQIAYNNRCRNLRHLFRSFPRWSIKKNTLQEKDRACPA